MRMTRLLTAAAVLGVFASHANAATITQLTAYGQLTPPVLLNNFEVSKNTAWVTFDASATLDFASTWSGGVTPSGVQGLVESAGNEPLTASLTADAFEVGLTFGNDDFGLAFNAILRVYDAGNVLLGTVTVAANRNDFADQFIGLRSDVGFRRVDISFQRPEAGNLTVYIDDFAVSNQTAIPEPVSLLLVGAGLAGLARRRYGRS